MTYYLARTVGWLVTRPFALIFYVWGWRVIGDLPDAKKFVVAAGPHTSGWDYVVMVGVISYFNRRPLTMVKAELMRGWRGFIVRLFGAIPIERSRSLNAVDQVVAEFEKRERMILTLSPEGTRRKTNHWKTGFYHIAHRAGVPIVLGAFHYGQKRAYIAEPFMPTGDIEADFEHIRQFFTPERTQGRHPERFSDIRLRGHSDQQSDEMDESALLSVK